MIKNSEVINRLQSSLSYAAVAATTIVSLLMVGFLAAEPAVSFGQLQATDEFIIRQTITGESSFLVPAPNVTMAGNIAGLTGGTATGTTQFVVRTNNEDGYYVDIDFAYPGGANEAMVGDINGNEAIRDYLGDSAGEPSGIFATTGSAQFAYTVIASSSAYLDPSFLNTGATCGSGSMTANTCWKAPSSSPFRIVDDSVSATTGATTTVQFKVHVPSGASPAPETQSYTATATLSLYTK